MHTKEFFPPPADSGFFFSFLFSESAATLEAESGYSMESQEVSQFKRYIHDGLWSKAEAGLPNLFQGDVEGLDVSRSCVVKSFCAYFSPSLTRMHGF